MNVVLMVLQESAIKID